MVLKVFLNVFLQVHIQNYIINQLMNVFLNVFLNMFSQCVPNFPKAINPSYMSFSLKLIQFLISNLKHYKVYITVPILQPHYRSITEALQPDNPLIHPKSPGWMIILSKVSTNLQTKHDTDTSSLKMTTIQPILSCYVVITNKQIFNL